MRIKDSTIRSIEAVVVMVGALAAWLFTPPEILLPSAFAALGVSVGGVWVLRKQIQKIPEQPYNANRDLLVEIGVVLGMLGLAAFIVLLEELFD